MGVIFCTVLLLGTGKFNTPNRHEIVQLDSGWTISRGNTSWELESIDHSNIGITNKGDEIVLSRNLPDSDLSPAALYFRSILSSIEVYVEDDLVYSFGKEYVDSGLMLPKMENFIPLPNDYQGKKLTVKITAREDNAFSGLSTFTFGN